MTATECIKILRENPNISVKKAIELTGLSRENVMRYAAYAGVELLSVRKARSLYCAKKPYSCDECPFTECIDNSPCTTAETEYVEKALGGKKKGR